MSSRVIEDDSFDEKEYLLANPDVAEAVRNGLIKSGCSHYIQYGKNENRRIWHSRPPINAEIRKIFSHYIYGNGIEIGALHNPLDVSGLPISNIVYVDRFSTEDLRKQYPDLINSGLAPVEVIDNGETLDKFAQESLDFIIANHFIEHARNPMGTIEKWLLKTKPGGIIFMAVPDKRHTFDVSRALTTLQHLVTDYHSTPEDRRSNDRNHFVEWAEHVKNAPVDQISAIADQLISTDYSIHFHTFTMNSFLEMTDCLRFDLKLPFTVKACADVLHGSNDFMILLERT